MLTIRKQQDDSICNLRLDSYKEELRQRLNERSPDLTATLKDESIISFLDCVTQGAERLGFTNRGPMRLYFDLCLSLGSGFVFDPVYAQLSKAIGDYDTDTQMERAEGLYQASLLTFEAINGSDDSYVLSAWQRIKDWAEDLQVSVNLEASDVIVEMQALYPQKAEYAGETALLQLYESAVGDCQAYYNEQPRPIMLLTILKFAFGSDCLQDPLYGWIATTLVRNTDTVSSESFLQLERKALIWLDAVVTKAI